MGNREKKRLGSFPLRLPASMRIQASDLARREGLSLNQFISLAVAEKITRLEQILWLKENMTREATASEGRHSD